MNPVVNSGTADAVAHVPLLSICIPTFNRAGWLRATLNYSAPQVQAMSGLVEIIVSDNASTDDTAEVVAELQEDYPLLRYSRNEKNVGCNPNMVHCVRDLARGEFVWVLGDDDFILPRTVAKVVSALQAYPEINFVHLNFGYFKSGLVAPTEPVEMFEFDKSDKFAHPDRTDHYVEKIADLVPGYPTCFASIYTSVFRRSHAIIAYGNCLRDKDWTTVNSVSSHALYIAEHMLNMPAYHIGTKGLMAGDDCSWQDKVGNYEMIFLPQLYETFERCGISKDVIDEHMKHVFRFTSLVRMPQRVFWRKPFPLRHLFSWKVYYQTFWKVKGLRRALIALPILIATYPLELGLWWFRPTRFVMHHILFGPLSKQGLKQRKMARS